MASDPCAHGQAQQGAQVQMGPVRESPGQQADLDAVSAHGGVLHVEKLLGIRDRTKKTRKVGRMLGPSRSSSASRYKAAVAGVQVIRDMSFRRAGRDTGPQAGKGLVNDRPW